LKSILEFGQANFGKKSRNIWKFGNLEIKV
jgi:hypothetical protein